MREISLVNEYEQEYALNNLDTGFFKNLSGVGFNMDYNYSRSGSAWIANKMDIKQTPVKGKVVIASHDPYMSEKEFLKFIRSTNRMRVKYKTSVGEWFKDVDIVGYDKGEMSKGALSCPITLMPKTLWYSSESARAQFVTSGDGLRYSYRLAARFNDFGNGYVEIDNDGSVGADFQVEFEGAIANPVIYIEVDGKETARVEIEGAASSGETILYQSKDGEGEHYCYFGDAEDIADFKNTGNTENLENLVTGFDITNANFFKIPVGLSRMYITADSALTNSITINIYKYYRAV